VTAKHVFKKQHMLLHDLLVGAGGRQGRNDLQAVAVRRYPEIAEHLAWLSRRIPEGSFAPRMTGSGGCVFAEFARQAEAQALYEQLPAAMRGFVARGLERHPLQEPGGIQ